MISLSKEWSILSKAIYGPEFINELAGFLRDNDIKTILECGCGDGHILYGLAKRGFMGIGIDFDDEMIYLATENHSHKDIQYYKLNWLELDRTNEEFGCVMCRGNSLTYVESWGKQDYFSTNNAGQKIIDSVSLMLKKVKSDGLLYLDTILQSEIDLGRGKVEFRERGIDLKGMIEHDWEKRCRYMHGGGKVGDEDFYGGSVSYLITPTELENIIRSFNPKEVWTPKLKYEKLYHVICARK